jgi:pimeloyl-ACP methyl ester carboxylesterase
VLDHVVPEGPVVLVGHSMGGMTIVTLAEQHPELIGDRVVGVGLISTTAGGLDPSRIFFPLLPAKVGSQLAGRTVRGLARRHKLVDNARRAGRSVATVVTDLFAFGDEVPAAYVEFVDRMLSQTPFEVVAEFFPSFHGLDRFHVVEALAPIPTTIICGTADRMTSIGHSRKLHEWIPGSTLVECEGAGHLVIMERHGQVNAALDQLLSAATERVAQK